MVMMGVVVVARHACRFEQAHGQGQSHGHVHDLGHARNAHVGHAVAHTADVMAAGPSGDTVVPTGMATDVLGERAARIVW